MQDKFYGKEAPTLLAVEARTTIPAVAFAVQDEFSGKEAQTLLAVEARSTTLTGKSVVRVESRQSFPIAEQ